MKQGITAEFGISRSRLRQIWYKCPLQKKIEGSQQQSMAEAPSRSPDAGSVPWRTVAGAMLLRDEEGIQLRRPSLNLQIVRFFGSFRGRPRLA